LTSATFTYELNRFEAVSSAGGPSWAKLPEEEGKHFYYILSNVTFHLLPTSEKDSDEEDEEALLQSTSSLVGERSKKELPQGGVFLTRCRDANHRDPSKVSCLLARMINTNMFIIGRHPVSWLSQKRTASSYSRIR
jgi:hypothetical protein